MIDNPAMPSKISKVLNRLIDSRGITNLSKLARDIGMSQSTLHRIKSGTLKNPSAENAQLIADHFGITVEQLLGEQPMGDKDLRDNDQLRRAAPVRLLPLISWVRAGTFCEASNPYEPGDAMDWVPVYERVSESSYVLEVRGDSMLNPHGDPSFPPGTRIIVDPMEEVLPGRFVIARIEEEDEVTFKRLVKDGGRMYLKPLNPAYPAISVDESTAFCGVVTDIAQRRLI